MRNLLEHPVTEKEITDLLLKIVDECSWDDGVGSMDGVILEQARQIVHAAYDMQRQLEERSKQRIPIRWLTPWDAASSIIRVLRGEKVYA